MKKIPTLFKRTFDNHRVVNISDEVTEGLEWVLNGEGIATIKYDGSCCAIINGELYKRYDAKAGKKAPNGAIPCCEPDPITGHHPHWIKCNTDNSSDKWFIGAYNDYLSRISIQHITEKIVTYEAVGPHFQGNPYGLIKDTLWKHGGDEIVSCPRTFDGIKSFLEENYIEGIVFWKDGEPKCKIKRIDFGLEWNGKQHK